MGTTGKAAQGFPMRRGKQALGDDESLEILRGGEFGVLGTGGVDGWPYAVPISYALVDGTRAGGAEAGDAERGAAAPERLTIAMHCALDGHKLEALRENPHVSFVVVGHTSVAPELLTAIYQSVIVFGTVREAVTDDEKRAGLLALGAKYCPGLEGFVDDEIGKLLRRTCVLFLEVESFTGKESIELVRARERN